MLRVALLGCGRIAQRHAGLLAENNVRGMSLATVCDIQENRAKQLGEKYNTPWFTDMHEMMRARGSEIDVISILTPSGLHAENSLQLTPYRKHLIVEKPIALTLTDADAMIRACDEAGVRLFVVKQNRYNLAVKKMKEAIDQGRLGKLVLGTVRVRWSRTQEYYDQDAWRGTWALDGGVFANQASHHIDLLIWMMGAVESVFAKTAHALANIEVEDTGVAVLKFTNGALGVIEATTATRPKDLEGSISILGEGGSIEIAGFAVNSMKTWNFVKTLPEDREVLENYSENPPNVYGFGHKGFLEHVVDCIHGGGSALIDGLEGRKSLELMLAMYESAETGKEVFLRFKPEKARLGMK
jgi:UDP-N-acetyl-2-amino-2-deoxyglucuronate dehydrogenase